MIHFLRNWQLRAAAADPALHEKGLGIVIAFASALLVMAAVALWQDLLLGVLLSMILAPLSAMMLLACAVHWLAPIVRRRQQGRTRSWLDGRLRDRWWQELEAYRLMRSWKRHPKRETRALIKASIWWEVWDIDEPGSRLLIQPLFDHRLKALAGEDPVSGEPFLMALPPSVYSVHDALEWLWGLPPGFWYNTDQIHET